MDAITTAYLDIIFEENILPNIKEIASNIKKDVKKGEVEKVLKNDLVKQLFNDLNLSFNDFKGVIKQDKKQVNEATETGKENSDVVPEFTEEQMKKIDEMVAERIGKLKEQPTWKKIIANTGSRILYDIIKYSIIAALVYQTFKYVSTSASEDPRKKAEAVQQCIDNYPEDPTIADKIEAFHQGASGAINGAANPAKTTALGVEKAKDEGYFKTDEDDDSNAVVKGAKQFYRGAADTFNILKKGAKKIASGEARQEYESRHNKK